jgi:hypothetical protein
MMDDGMTTRACQLNMLWLPRFVIASYEEING